MSRNYRIIFGTLLSVFALYVASYWYVRQSNTILHIECDGCPVDGWEEINFPIDGLFVMYGPLYQLDKVTSPSSSEFRVIRIDQ